MIYQVSGHLPPNEFCSSLLYSLTQGSHQNRPFFVGSAVGVCVGGKGPGVDETWGIGETVAGGETVGLGVLVLVAVGVFMLVAVGDGVLVAAAVVSRAT